MLAWNALAVVIYSLNCIVYLERVKRKVVLSDVWPTRLFFLHCEVCNEQGQRLLVCSAGGTGGDGPWAMFILYKLPPFVVQTKNPLALVPDALIIPWSQFRLIFAFSPVWSVPCLFRNIEQEIKNSGSPCTKPTPDILGLLGADFFPNRPDLLSQVPLFYPASQSLSWLLNQSLDWSSSLLYCWKQGKPLPKGWHLLFVPGNLSLPGLNTGP